MRTAKGVGRAVGLALLIPILVSPALYFRLLQPLAPTDYLAATAGSAMQIRVALLLMLALTAMTLTVAILVLPIMWRYSERMAVAYVVLGTIVLATGITEALAIRGMVALSLEYVKDGAPRELLEVMGRAARSSRLAAHFTNLMFGHAAILFLFVMLYRLALVPRLLAGAGVVASIVSTTAVTMPLLGYTLNFTLIAPMGIMSLAITLWLLVKGFPEPAETRQHA